MEFNTLHFVTAQPIPGVFPVLPDYRWNVWLVLASVAALILTIAAFAIRSRGSPSTLRHWGLPILMLVAGVALAGGVWINHVRNVARDQAEVENDPEGASGNSLDIDRSDWPTDRGNWSRSGVAGSDIGPREGHVLWRHQRDAEAFFGSPAFDGERIYCVGSTGDHGRIYAFDALNGKVDWAVSPPDYRATFSSPVLRGGRLYCGEGLHHAQQARLVCLDLQPGRAGKLLWSFTAASHIESTPTISGTRIFFGAGDDGVYGLEEVPDSTEPRVLFHRTATSCPDAETAGAVVDHRLYVGLGLGGQALVAIDIRDGREIGRLRFPHPVFGLPSVAFGKLYVGMGQGDYLTPNSTAAGQVVCVDLADFRLDWTFPLSSSVLGAVVIANDELVWGCSDGSVYVAGLDGRERQRYSTGAAMAASLAVTSERIYAVNFDGRLLALSRAKLDLLWSLRIGSPGRYTGSPLVALGRVYVGTHEDGFVCVGEREQEP